MGQGLDSRGPVQTRDLTLAGMLATWGNLGETETPGFCGALSPTLRDALLQEKVFSLEF